VIATASNPAAMDNEPFATIFLRLEFFTKRLEFFAKLLEFLYQTPRM
jgi:hypothetical protein